jgi:hypothetical protein
MLLGGSIVGQNIARTLHSEAIGKSWQLYEQLAAATGSFVNFAN